MKNIHPQIDKKLIRLIRNSTNSKQNKHENKHKYILNCLKSNIKRNLKSIQQKKKYTT